MKKTLFVLCLLIPIWLQAKDKDVKVNVVFIGNSITQGALLQDVGQDAPPVQAVKWILRQEGVQSVKYSNQGISGMTTVDFLPASGTHFPNVKAAADKLIKEDPKAVLLFSMMLGTNDSAIKGPNGAPVSPQQYYTNVKAIIDELLSLYPKAVFVLHRPIWYSPNTYNGAMYLKEGLLRLEKYYPQIQKLVEAYAIKYPNQLFVGDSEAFDYFRTNYQTEFVPEDGNAGTFYLHPNKSGAAKLGEFWGKALYRILTSTHS